MDYDSLNRIRDTTDNRYSSSIYSSASASGGGGGATSGGDGVDGDVDDSSHISRNSSNIHNTTQNGVDRQNVSTKENKGKKKLSRESFKNMGKALSGAISESAHTIKSKTHRHGNGKSKTSRKGDSDHPDFDGNAGELETIQSRHDEEEEDFHERNDDNNDAHRYQQQIHYNMYTTAAGNNAVSMQLTRGNDDEEESQVDPEILVRERELDRTTYISIALDVILLAGVVVGITFCAMIPLSIAFQILGPTILGLSAFALVYKIYVTVMWKEDPYRWYMKRHKRCTRRCIKI